MLPLRNKNKDIKYLQFKVYIAEVFHVAPRNLFSLKITPDVTTQF